MELREFITETLVQIQEGVQGAIDRRRASANSAGAINPVWGADANAINADHLQKVDFDVAVTVTDKGGVSGKGGLKIFSFEMGAEASKSLEHSTASRIKFTVPIIPAVQIVGKA